jgi:aminopeptidase N
MKSLLLSFILVAFFLTGNAQKDSTQNITLDTLNVSAPAGALIYRGAETRAWEIVNIRVALSFNFKEKTADVREWIQLHPHFYATDSLELDAKSMRIDSVLLMSKKLKTQLHYTYENDRLKIHFGKAFQSQDSIELYLKYKAMPYSEPTGGSAAITDDRGLYFINTDGSVPNKPMQIWTQGETESNSHWMITIDKPNTRFTTQIELTVPDSFVTLSNGAIIKQAREKNGLRTDTWKMDMPIQAYAVMFAAGKFSILKDHWKNKEVNYYVEPGYAKYAALMFKHTPGMIDHFSKRTGVPYPWNKYSQVVVRDYISGAMENTSASLFGEFMNQNAREIADKSYEDVVSHELFHQWFGDYVTAESWSNLTVNESFANYGEQLWRAYKYGKAAADELAYADLQIYIAASQINDPQLVRYYYDSREEVFDAITYNKGGAILRYMNIVMGDAAFDKAMNIYLTKNALHSTEAAHWRMAVEEATGQDWNWFFNEWYYHAGHPVLKVNYNYNDAMQRLEVTVSQTQADSTFIYKLPLTAALIYGHDREVVSWNIKKRTDTFIYNYKNGSRPVVIPDYSHALPGELTENKAPDQWMVQFARADADDYISKKIALVEAGKLLSDPVSDQIIDLALSDRIDSIRRIAMIQLKKEQDHKKWASKVLAIANKDDNKLVRASAFWVLGSWKDSAAKAGMVRALSDSSYALTGAALDGIYKLDKDTAYVLARMLLPSDPKAALESSIWSIIGGKGADKDITLYEAKAPYVLGTRKFTFALSLNSYLKNVQSDESFNRGIKLYEELIENESMKAYRSALGWYLFQLVDEEKEHLKSGKKEEQEAAKNRLGILKAMVTKMAAGEKDPEILKEYIAKMKSAFE